MLDGSVKDHYIQLNSSFGLTIKGIDYGNEPKMIVFGGAFMAQTTRAKESEISIKEDASDEEKYEISCINFEIWRKSFSGIFDIYQQMNKKTSPEDIDKVIHYYLQTIGENIIVQNETMRIDDITISIK